MKVPSIEDLPNEFAGLDWVLDKVQFVAAMIVVGLFIIGVVDLGILIYEEAISGQLTEVKTVVELIEFLLLLFIIVEVYETIAAYAQNKQPKYILTLVVYTGVIAIVRRILVFHPEDMADSAGALFVSVGFGVLLISLGILLFIIDQYGDPMENASLSSSLGSSNEDDKKTSETEEESNESSKKEDDDMEDSNETQKDSESSEDKKDENSD